ncbi:hypothetical protein EYF80_028318 [Liparis tanakae]|uniref:Uncharacterized protein n=1 Tax=Liparis tanakae TaxID=230148 RepID=A0A4Z2H6N2_9TELE|nr:hypothetical protein EYF80_028318 [Liparis tanakae]
MKRRFRLKEEESLVRSSATSLRSLQWDSHCRVRTSFRELEEERVGNKLRVDVVLPLDRRAQTGADGQTAAQDRTVQLLLLEAALSGVLHLKAMMKRKFGGPLLSGRWLLHKMGRENLTSDLNRSSFSARRCLTWVLLLQSRRMEPQQQQQQQQQEQQLHWQEHQRKRAELGLEWE